MKLFSNGERQFWFSLKSATVVEYVYANDDPVNLVDPSGNFPSFSFLFAGWVPIGVAVKFSSRDLAAFNAPGSPLTIGLLGGAATALLYPINPPLSFVGGLLVAFIAANGRSIATACPGGASVVYLFGDIEPFDFCD